MDCYKHVRDRFKENGVFLPNVYGNNNKHAPLDVRKSLLEEIRKIKSDVEICGEPDIICDGCVSKRDFKALHIDTSKIIDDKSQQRPACNCIGNKFELLDNKQKCPHNCIYCYWH